MRNILLHVGGEVHPYVPQSLQVVVLLLRQTQHISIDVVIVLSQPHGRLAHLEGYA